jgi:outer membrane biosynthesis protein TonB
MEWALRREEGGPPRLAFWVSLALHTFVVLALFAGSWLEPAPLDFTTYRIEMVAMPAQQAELDQPEPASSDLVVETPDPVQPEPEPEPDIPPPPPDDTRPEPEPEPEPAEPEPEPEPEAPKPEPKPTQESPTPRTQTDPERETESDAGSDVNVRLEGVRRDYPQYYENIIRQIERCFTPPGGVRAVTAVLYFEIRRDGTVTGLRFVQRSGLPDFDLSALAAIGDCAGRQGRFGVLPDDLPYDRLPVQFTFRPR